MSMADVLRVVGEIAGIAGLGVGVLLLVYRDFIRSFFRAKAFKTLSSAQATMLLGAAIALTFAIAVLGLFAGLVGNTNAAPFILLVGLLLAFVIAVLLIATQRGHDSDDRGTSASPDPNPFSSVSASFRAGNIDEADSKLTRTPAALQESVDYWYWKSQVACGRQNLEVALAYVGEALNRDPRDTHSIALQIRLLLLSAGRTNRSRAQQIASRSYGISDDLDNWLDCLTARGMFAPGITSNSDIDTKCPLPLRGILERAVR